MSLPIKFRAWDKIKSEMRQPFGVQFNGDAWAPIGPRFAEDFVLMQFTGLQDKNGKEIWEGDVVSWEWEKIKGLKGDPAFVTMETIFEDDKRGQTGWIAKNKGGFLCFVDSTCEVLGNIYENPEILK